MTSDGEPRSAGGEPPADDGADKNGPPASISALDKHACPACGAQAEWNPVKQKLVCPFCGTESPYKIDTTACRIQEIDLARTLHELPDERRGWKSERPTVQCQSCKAVMVFEAGRVGQNCEFCGSPALVAYNELKAPITPQSLLPFKVPLSSVREHMRAWYASKWLAPNKLKVRALVDRVHGLYIPYWTFDATVRCPWDAEAGYYYYVNVEYRDSNGRTQVRKEQRIRWEAASGVVEHFFDDVLVAGTQGIRHDLLTRVEPFPTGELVPYDTAYLSGHVVEHYQIVLPEAAAQSKEAMTKTLFDLAVEQVPGDTYRNMRIRPDWSGETFKHVLVPVWMLTYTYGPRTFQMIANGYTGRMAGTYPLSPWKVAFVTLLVILLVLLVLYAQNN